MEVIVTMDFSENAIGTAKIYLQVIPWYRMTPTAHIVMIQRAELIENSLDHIGHLTEESVEIRNKLMKKISATSKKKRSQLRK